MQILEKGHVRGLPEALGLGSHSFPAMEILPSGRWLAGFRAADKKKDGITMKAMMTWSDDGGRSWVPPFEPVQMPPIGGRPGNSHSLYFLALGESRVMMVINWVDASEPKAPFFDPKYESLKDTRIFYSFSENEGRDWSAPRLMDTESAKGPVPLTGPPMALTDGTLICQFEINKFRHDPKPWLHRSAFLFSHDSGNSWGNLSLVTNHPGMYYWDQRPAVLQDGQALVNFFWTFDGRRNQYQNIHRAESRDGGKSWSQPEDTGIYGQPGRPVALKDGRLALVAIDRRENPEIFLYISRDEGKTFESALCIETLPMERQDSRYMQMQEAWAEMSRFSIGHPQLMDLGNQELLAYYYRGTHPDNTGIRFIRLAVGK
ncbi:MAG: sialidase family protein [Cyclobacteriaceae bacterium]